MSHDDLTIRVQGFLDAYHALCVQHGLEIRCIGQGDCDVAIVNFHWHPLAPLTSLERELHIVLLDPPDGA